jgi:hypothetical protein
MTGHFALSSKSYVAAPTTKSYALEWPKAPTTIRSVPFSKAVWLIISETLLVVPSRCIHIGKFNCIR